MKEESIPVTIKIMDKEYRIACKADEKDNLLSSAKLLNDKMSEIRSSGKVIGSDRVAVMAALNLAHDLLQKQRTDIACEQMRQQIRQMREKVDVAVNAAKQMEL